MSHPDETRRAPTGHFRVICYDKYDRTDYVVNDFPTFGAARDAADAMARVPNASPTSFSDDYFVYDDRRVCSYRVTHDDLKAGGAVTTRRATTGDAVDP